MTSANMANDPSTGTSSRAVLGRGSLYTISTAAPILVAVLVTPIVTRLLGPVEYGVIALSLVIIQVASMLGGLGLAASVTRHGILEKSGIGGARSIALGGALLSLTLLAGAAALSWFWIPVLLGVPWSPAILAALIASIGFATLVNVQALLRVVDRPLIFIGVTSIATLGGPGLGVLLLSLRASSDPSLYVLGLLVGHATAGLVGVLVVRSLVPFQPFIRREFLHALRVGLPAVPHQVSLFLLNGSMVLVAAHLYGEAGSARIQLALVLGTAPSIIVAALNNSWAPIVYRADLATRGRVLEETARDVMVLAAGLAGVVSLSAPLLLRFLAPAEYSTDQLVVAVSLVALGAMLSVAYLANVHLVFASGKSGLLALITPISLVAGVASALIISTTLQSVSLIAVAFPTSYSVLAIGTAILRRRLDSVKWREAALIVPALAGSAACIAGAMLPSSGYGIWVRGGMILALACYVLSRVVSLARSTSTDRPVIDGR